MSDANDWMNDGLLFACSVEDSGRAEVYRIGRVGQDGSVVVVEVVSNQPELDIDGSVATCVLLTPAMARRMAVALIEFADECEGAYAPFVLSNDEEDAA